MLFCFVHVDNLTFAWIVRPLYHRVFFLSVCLYVYLWMSCDARFISWICLWKVDSTCYGLLRQFGQSKFLLWFESLNSCQCFSNGKNNMIQKVIHFLYHQCHAEREMIIYYISRDSDSCSYFYLARLWKFYTSVLSQIKKNKVAYELIHVEKDITLGCPSGKYYITCSCRQN